MYHSIPMHMVVTIEKLAEAGHSEGDIRSRANCQIHKQANEGVIG